MIYVNATDALTKLDLLTYSIDGGADLVYRNPFMEFTPVYVALEPLVGGLYASQIVFLGIAMNVVLGVVLDPAQVFVSDKMTKLTSLYYKESPTPD